MISFEILSKVAVDMIPFEILTESGDYEHDFF
jgi:hypothetical protein